YLARLSIVGQRYRLGTLPPRSHAHDRFFFFFKQKTAYEIGLGIPAEPLFRSLKRLFVSSHLSEVIYVWCYCWRYCFCSCWWRHVRSEERRVGKECRSRGSPQH